MKQESRAPEKHPGPHAGSAGCLRDNYYHTLDAWGGYRPQQPHHQAFFLMTMSQTKATNCVWGFMVHVDSKESESWSILPGKGMRQREPLSHCRILAPILPPIS